MFYWTYNLVLTTFLSRSTGKIPMECKVEKNKSFCSCSYSSCPRQGICCDCVQYHLGKRQVPGCFFPADAEKTYDRSFEHFARLVTEKKV